jgi:hypothetical protein
MGDKISKSSTKSAGNVKHSSRRCGTCDSSRWCASVERRFIESRLCCNRSLNLTREISLEMQMLRGRPQSQSLRKSPSGAPCINLSYARRNCINAHPSLTHLHSHMTCKRCLGSDSRCSKRNLNKICAKRFQDHFRRVVHEIDMKLN